MSFDNLLKVLEAKVDRQRKALAETERQLTELRELLSKVPKK